MEKNIEKKISIDTIIKNYNMRSSDKLKREYLLSVIKVKPYLGYGTKMKLADGIIEVACLENGYVHIDSCKKYLLYIYAILANYTNLDIKEDGLLFQYNELDKNGLIEEILSIIPEKELTTFKTILDMKQNDLISNKYENHAFINDKLNEFYIEMHKTLHPLIENVGLKLETLDEKKIEKAFNKVAKLLK